MWDTIFHLVLTPWYNFNLKNIMHRRYNTNTTPKMVVEGDNNRALQRVRWTSFLIK
jgi:hypothetical protein